MVDLLFVIIELYSLSLTVETLGGNLSKLTFFEGVGHFERKLETEGASLTNHSIMTVGVKKLQ